MSLLSAFHEIMGSGQLVTLNPSDKSVAVTLSGGNLVATKNAVAAFGNARTTTALTPGGKSFWATTITAIGGTAGAGIANSTANLNDYPGADTNGAGYFATTGEVLINAVVLATIFTATTADVIDTAYDDTAKLIWFRKNGGNWNNSGAANPATGAGGIDTSSAAAGPYFPVASVYQSAVETMNFGASTFTYVPPGGFSPVGG